MVALRIDGKKVTRTNEVEVRGLPEGVVFSNDGRYVYVGNYLDRDISILRVDGDQLVNTGKIAAAARSAGVDARSHALALPGVVHRMRRFRTRAWFVAP